MEIMNSEFTRPYKFHFWQLLVDILRHLIMDILNIWISGEAKGMPACCKVGI